MFAPVCGGPHGGVPTPVGSGRDPARAARFDAIKPEEPDLSGGVKYLASDRHGNYVQHDAYLAELRRLRKRMGWQDVRAEDFAAQLNRSAASRAA